MLGVTKAQVAKTPSVTVENVTLTTPTSVSFDIAVHDDCVKYLYVIADTSFMQMATAFGMTQAQFLEQMSQYGISWVPAVAGQVDNYTTTDLEPNAMYVIYVLAKNAQNEPYVVEHPFMTSMSGGTGTAELTMTVTQPLPTSFSIDVAINDQTAYYWYFVFSDPLLQQMGYANVESTTTPQYYELLDRMVNEMGLSYLVHTSPLTEEMSEEDMELGVRYVAVAFPFNADGVLGTYTQPIVFAREVGVAEYDRVEMRVWPNPTEDYVNLSADEDIQRVRVVDLHGHLVMDETFESQTVRLNISGLSAGAYLVNIHTAHGVATKPLLIKGR